MNGQQDLQAIIDFQIELHKFINIDLFQRGLYQIRVNHHISSKLPHKIEVNFLEDRAKKKDGQIALSNIVFPPSLINGVAVSKTFSILYKNEEVLLNDVVHFKDHLIVSSAADCFEQLSNVEFYLDVELWFTETAYVPNNPDLIRLMFRRQLRLHFNACTGLSYFLPVTFDYFHLSTVTLSVHACLVSLCLPYLFKQGLNKGGQLETSQNEGLGYDYLFFGCSINDIHREREQNAKNGKCAEILKLRERVAQLQHWQLCSLLLTSIENLSRRFDEYLRLLPPLMQCKYRKEKPQFQLSNLSKLTQQCHRSCLINEFKSGSPDFIHFQNLSFARDVLKKSDEEIDSEILIGKQLLAARPANVESNSDVVRSEANNSQPSEKQPAAKLDKNDNVMNEFGSPILQPEDFIASLVMDLAYICGSLIVIWQSFIKLITHNEKINQHLSKIHHLHRCKRFSEAFFVKEKPLSQLISPHKDGQLFYELSEKLRKSKYLQSLPVCQIECASLDGDCATMPIIFEEKFDLNEELAACADQGETEPPPPPPADKRNDKKTVDETKKNLRRSSSDLSTNSSLTNSSCNSATNSSTDHTNNSTEDKQPPKSKFKDKFSLNLNRLNLNRSITRRKSSISYLSKQEQQKMVVNENLSASSSTNNSNNSSLNSHETSKSLNVEANESEPAVDSPRIVINGGDDQVDGKPNAGSKNSKNSGESPKSLMEEFGNCPAKLIGFRHYNNVKGKPEEFLFDKNNGLSIYSLVETVSLNKFQQIDDSNQSKSKHKKKKLSSSESLPDLSVKQLQKTIKRITKKNSKKFKFRKDKSSKQASSRVKSADCTERTKGDLLIDTISLNFPTNIDSLNKTNLDLNEKDEFSDLDDLDGFIDEDDEQTTESSSLVHFNKNEDENAAKKNDSDKANDKADGKTDDKADAKADGSKIDAKTAKSNSINSNNKCTILEMFARNTCLVCGVENCSCIQNFELTVGSKRLAMITEELVAFIKAKEQFRQEMSLKTNGWQFYSDFSNPASRIPYFQCDNDLIRTFNSDGVHLIICVHGLDGNCADLRLVKTYLELGLPTCNFDFLMSEANTGKTYESFEIMTNRLCDEILKHLQTNCLQPTKISFIGHSLGNLIIRSVLRKPELAFLLPKLHCFLSLSGPHLGTIYMTNGLVNIGLWFMQKWKKSTSLLQLCLKDNVDPYKTFIYNLSKDSKLHHFKYVLLCGSSQDSYVPLHSAHIQLTTQSVQDTSLTGQAYRDMINNIVRPFLAKNEEARLSSKEESVSLDGVTSSMAKIDKDELGGKRCSKLMRFNVWHAEAGGTNSLIGRQAHISCIDCELFIEKFMTICGLKYFA